MINAKSHDAPGKRLVSDALFGIVEHYLRVGFGVAAQHIANQEILE